MISMNRFLRCVVIVLIAAVTVWFGLSYGPAPGVRADIYTDLASAYRSAPGLASGAHAERAGTTLLNGNRIYYRVSTSARPMHEVLDEYQEMFTPKQFQLFPHDRLPDMAAVIKVAPQLPFLEFLMNQKRIVREETGQWGMVSFLDMGEEANRDWHAVFKRKLEKFARSGRLGDLGVAKTVMAVPSAAGGLTTVISYWTDPDFNMRDLSDLGTGDHPGRDVADFPRIQPTRRLLTFEQADEKFPFMMVMYETTLSPDMALGAYDAESSRLGWHTRRQNDPQRGGEVLFLNRGAAEAQILVRTESGKTLVLVDHRILN